MVSVLAMKYLQRTGVTLAVFFIT